MEFFPAGQLLLHLARRLEGKKGKWRTGTKEEGLCVCQAVLCTCRCCPFRMDKIGTPSLPQSFTSLSSPPQTQSLGVRMVDEQEMGKRNECLKKNLEQKWLGSVKGTENN